MKRATHAKKLAARLAPADDGGASAPSRSTRPARPASAEDRAAEASAAEQRQRDYEESYEMVWNEQPLQPFSRARESLLGRLIAADVPSGLLDDLPAFLRRIDQVYAKTKPGIAKPTLGQVCDLNYYLPAAAKLLYLCSHEPDQWDHLRGNTGKFIRAIEEWAEENISPEQVEEACLLAQKIRFAHRSQMAMHQPVKGRKGSSSGN